jgi:hypothetical protein
MVHRELSVEELRSQVEARKAQLAVHSVEMVRMEARCVILLLCLCECVCVCVCVSVRECASIFL